MSNSKNILLRPPTLKDGMSVFRLIENCPPLDVNSSYCNLLQCSHFFSTSVVAEVDGALAGFISGYIVPERPDTLFIWQVAVAKQARGLGLASSMLVDIVSRPQCAAVSYLETTITEDNQPSWALFKGLAKKLSAELQSSQWMDSKVHFDGEHDSETLVRIGPFNSLKIDEE